MALLDMADGTNSEAAPATVIERILVNGARYVLEESARVTLSSSCIKNDLFYVDKWRANKKCGKYLQMLRKSIHEVRPIGARGLSGRIDSELDSNNVL